MNIINIALAADDNYAQHAAVVIASVMENSKTKHKIRFFLLSDGIDSKKLLLLKQTAEKYSAELEIIDLTDKAVFNNLYTSGHISRAAYFRLALPEILPKDVSKIIYCDVDLLVLDDIEQLWNYDMQNLPLAAVADYGIMASGRLMRQKHKFLQLPLEREYFNSGVLIIDVQQWREHNYAKQVIDLASVGNFPHHDQDALNKIFMYKWGGFPLRWNVIPPVFNLFTKIVFNKTFRKNAVAAKKNIAILHYAGRYKPWEFTAHNGFNDKYYHYLQLTAFRDFPMPQPGNNMKGKSITRQMFRLKLADFWVKIFG